jgi:hypothetical protein
MDNTLPEIPISIGELMDKWVILQIKASKITDTAKLDNVLTELEILNDIAKPYQYGSNGKAVTALLTELFDVNTALWMIEDEIRELERINIPQKFFIFMNDGDFLSDIETTQVIRFVKLAQLVYITNDKRCAVKRQINELLLSGFLEEKSYTEY